MSDSTHPLQGALNVEGLGPLCELYHGEKGMFAYLAYAWLNARVFDGSMPVPLFQWALTDFGGCMGFTMSRARDIVKPPVIDLHPAVWEYALYKGKDENGWVANIPYGRRYTLDVILHELIHVEVHYLRGGVGAKAHSSHDNETWCEAIMRAALKLKGTNAGAAAVQGGTDEALP